MSDLVIAPAGSCFKLIKIITGSEMEARIKLMQTRLELKLEEGRNVNQELSRVREEKVRLEQENTRLRHR